MRNACVGDIPEKPTKTQLRVTGDFGATEHIYSRTGESQQRPLNDRNRHTGAIRPATEQDTPITVRDSQPTSITAGLESGPSTNAVAGFYRSNA